MAESLREGGENHWVGLPKMASLRYLLLYQPDPSLRRCSVGDPCCVQLLEEEASEAVLAEPMLEGLGGALGMPSSEGRGHDGASLQVSVNSRHASFCLIPELAYTVYVFSTRSVLQDLCCRCC